MEAIIFCGIQASGKTTFYQEKFFRTHIRISLDLLRTRNKEWKFMETCFSTQQRFVVDNTNPTREDRFRYISAAKQHNFKVIGYFFQSKIDDAIERNAQREEKESIPAIAIKGTYHKMEIPNFDEGFDELYYVMIENEKFVINTWEDEI